MQQHSTNRSNRSITTIAGLATATGPRPTATSTIPAEQQTLTAIEPIPLEFCKTIAVAGDFVGN